MKSLIAKNIYWVGALEWSKKFFHGYEISMRQGTSYNSYLIDDEKKVLVDLVRINHADDLLKNIDEILPVEKLDYLIVNHAEHDHASAMNALLARNPDIKIYCSRAGKISISRQFPKAKNIEIVKTGDSISTGSRTIKFFEAPMLHWPDSMFSYCVEDKVLFSTDAFGQHYATHKRFEEENDQRGLWWEAEKYFANILTPYSAQILRKLEEFQKLNWELEVIAPAHGVCWRKDISKIIKQYLAWAKGVEENTAIVIFDTMWGGTEKMANAICSGLANSGIGYKLYSVGVSDLSDVMTEVLTAKAVVLGSPTLNNGITPTIAPFIEELHGLRFKGKIGAAFGTYGWSGECVKILEEGLRKAKIEIVQEGIKFQYNALPEDLEKCEQFGRELGEKIKKHGE